MRRAFFLSVVALGIGFGGGCRSKTQGVGALAAVSGAGAPSQILHDFQMQDIENGLKNMMVESVLGRLLDAEHVTDVDKPIITFYKKGAVSSVLHAPHGQVQMDTHEVDTWGGVTVVTPDSATLTTDRLRYDPKTQHLLSDDPVRLERPTSVTEGIGLDALPDLSNVKIGHEKVHLKKLES